MDTEIKSGQKAEKPRYSLWQNTGFMIGRAWRYGKSVLVLCVLAAALSVGMSLIRLLVTPAILEAIQQRAPISQLIGTIVLFAAALMLVQACTSYIEANRLFGKVDVRTSLANSLHTKYMTTSFPNTESQDMLKRLEKGRQAINNNMSAGEAIWTTLTELMTNAAGFVIYLILLTSLNPVIILAVFLTTAAGFFASKRINEWGYRHRDEEAEYEHRMYYIYQKGKDYTLAKDIRIFGMRGWLTDVYTSWLTLYRSFLARREKVYIWANVIDLCLNFLRNGIAYVYLFFMIMNDGLTAPEFLLYFSAIGGFAQWVRGIFDGFATLHKHSLDLSTLRDVLDYPEPFAFEEGAVLEPGPAKPYRIELRNVSYRYPGAKADTLTSIDLSIEAGEKLAVVGLNGAGKTTLVKLICGFFDPTQGEVLLNGVDIRTYNRRDYYRHFSAVFQDMSVLAVSIRENITQGWENVDEERVRACAERAGIAAHIETLPMRYDTPVGKEVYEGGVELSGGELQRLMLARALYKDAPIIVLDEPTAALDPIAESDMYQRYHELTGGRTSVYISHRLASTRFCDRIILIDGNTIAEEGTHDALMAAGGRYAGLFDIQSQYYREGAVENA